jgi:hypothetical protein
MTEGRQRLVAAAHVDWTVSLMRDSYALAVHLKSVRSLEPQRKDSVITLGITCCALISKVFNKSE